MYLYAGPHNSQINLEAHEAEGATDEGEHHDGDDLLGGQARPCDHLRSVKVQKNLEQMVLTNSFSSLAHTFSPSTKV